MTNNNNNTPLGLYLIVKKSAGTRLSLYQCNVNKKHGYSVLARALGNNFDNVPCRTGDLISSRHSITTITTEITFVTARELIHTHSFMLPTRVTEPDYDDPVPEKNRIRIQPSKNNTELNLHLTFFFKIY